MKQSINNNKPKEGKNQENKNKEQVRYIENKQQGSRQKFNHIKIFHENDQMIPNKIWRQ